jgi:hypothetical protein
MRRLLRLALVVVASCGSSDPVVPADTVPPPDVGACTDTNVACNGDVLTVCTEPGAAVIEEPCGWGCNVLGSSPRCNRLTPTGGGANVVDATSSVLAQFRDFSLSGTLDGTQGKINGATAESLGVGYALVNGIAVFRFNSLAIGGIKLQGTAPIVLVAHGEITVSGTLDATGACGIGAPEIAGAGGGNGGETSGADGALEGGGKGGVANDGTGAGGGGGFGVAGGDSGGGELGGPAAGDAVITLLRGGAGGGAGVGTARGGGGGGAIQLISNTRIRVTLAGNINAGGCGGRRGTANGEPGGGGGAGGAIVFEAPEVVVEAGRVLAVNGGAGGGGGVAATDGGAGRLGREPALGGNAGLTGGAGGNGGAGAALGGAAGGAATFPGGGGGAVGRIRINTRTGTATLDGILSPALEDPNSTATLGTAAVQ